jgi:hypothetical protein
VADKDRLIKEMCSYYQSYLEQHPLVALDPRDNISYIMEKNESYHDDHVKLQPCLMQRGDLLSKLECNLRDHGFTENDIAIFSTFLKIFYVKVIGTYIQPLSAESYRL